MSEKKLNEVLALKFDAMVKIEVEVIVDGIRRLNEKIARLEERRSPARGASWKGTGI